jgi:hypothetical protein
MTDILNKDIPWDIIDKSKIIIDVKITLQGYIGKTSENKLYKCSFPCKGSGTDRWSLTNETDFGQNDVISSIEANSEIISIIKNNDLYTCDNTCSSNTLTKESNVSKQNYSLESGGVIDYIYPKIELLPAITPLPSGMISDINTSLTQKNNKYDSVMNLLDNIKDKVATFKTKQQNFDNQFNNLKNQQKQIVDNIINKVGLREGFGTIEKIKIDRVVSTPNPDIKLIDINHKIQQKVKLRGNEPTPHASTGDSVIIAL